MSEASLLNRLLRARLVAERSAPRPRSVGDRAAGRGSIVASGESPLTSAERVRRSIEESRAARCGDGERSLRLAGEAVEDADRLEATALLPQERLADLRAEALLNLGHAHLVFSDLSGAGTAAAAARRQRLLGSGDGRLEAEMLSLGAAILALREEIEPAATLRDREIELRRRLGDRERLAVALVHRGLLAAWFEPLAVMCDFLEQGVEASDDPGVMLVALEALAGALAREGQRLESWCVEQG